VHTLDLLCATCVRYLRENKFSFLVQVCTLVRLCFYAQTYVWWSGNYEFFLRCMLLEVLTIHLLFSCSPILILQINIICSFSALVISA